MAQTSWPFANIDTSVTQFSQWARNIDEGVKGSSSTTDLKPFGDSTGLQVKVNAGQALVRGHYFYSDAIVTLPLTAANATYARIDLVVLTLDPSVNSIVLSVIAGTPAASPIAPALTQTDAGVYQLALGTVAVAANASTIAAGNVTDTRTFMGGKFLTPTGVATMSNKTLLATMETTNVTAAGPAAGGSVDLVTANDWLYTSTTGANFSFNFRGSASYTLNTMLAVGATITATCRVTNGATPYYATSFTIDGSPVTPKWQNGVAPSAGNANAMDVYSFVITKTSATPTYTVLGSLVKFA